MKRLLFILIPIFLFSSEAQIALDYAKVDNYLSKLQACSDNDFFSCKEKMDQFYDLTEVKKFINQRCKELNMPACYSISNLTDKKQVQFNALRLACQNNFKLACTKIVVKFEGSSLRAIDILKKQCENEQNFNSCHALAELYAGFFDRENAKKYSENNCKKKFYNSCVLLAEIYVKENDEKKAIDILQNSCNNNYKEACVLAYNYSVKMGEFKTSKKILEKLCSIGDEFFCSKLKGI